MGSTQDAASLAEQSSESGSSNANSENEDLNGYQICLDTLSIIKSKDNQLQDNYAMSQFGRKSMK